MRDGKLISLWVSESDLNACRFSLKDLLDRLPKDTAIVRTWSSFSTSHVVYSLHSEEFPAIEESRVIPRADFIYDEKDGITIKWPSQEYEDIALKYLNKKIEKDSSPANTLNGLLTSIFPSSEQQDLDELQVAKLFQQLAAKGTTTGRIPVGCPHEWFAYGRTAAMKHCKKCGKVTENI
jgi:hypothetical protein